MKMDWFKYTRHVLVWWFSTLFFFTIISADYVDVQVATLVACLFAPFLFEPKTKWIIDLAIIVISVFAVLFTQTYRIAFTYSEITYLLISLIILILIDLVISHKGFTKRIVK